MVAATTDVQEPPHRAQGRAQELLGVGDAPLRVTRDGPQTLQVGPSSKLVQVGSRWVKIFFPFHFGSTTLGSYCTCRSYCTSSYFICRYCTLSSYCTEYEAFEERGVRPQTECVRWWPPGRWPCCEGAPHVAERLGSQIRITYIYNQ